MTATSTPIIKPLQWKGDRPAGTAYTRSVAALRQYHPSQCQWLYEIRQYDDEKQGFYLYWHLADRNHEGPFLSLKSAQAAAQKDWERFIRAAVDGI